MAWSDEWERQHAADVESYVSAIRRVFLETIREAAAIAATIRDFDPEKLFRFADYPIAGTRIDTLFHSFAESIETIVIDGIAAQWALANACNDELVRKALGKNAAEAMRAEFRRRYFTNNSAAQEAFAARKIGGLGLSDRIWHYTVQFKEEIELGLDLGIRDGLSADRISRQLRQYLNEPQRLFRRVRDEHGQLVLSQSAQAYHPGQGVYRSSYKNARRLAATETNMAYRTADYLRWQQLDFVVGIEISLSNNHTLNGEPFHDICDELAGKYPKDFKFTGWHPLCRCYATPVLKTEEEMAEDDARILRGEMPTATSKNTVEDVPLKFKRWIEENQDRISAAKSLPYFLKDNRQYVGENIFLDRDAVQLMRSARQVGDKVQELAENIASKYGAICTPINYKSKASIVRKVKLVRQDSETPNFAPSDLKDAVRTTIITGKNQIDALFSELSNHPSCVAWKNQLPVKYLGYSGKIANFKMSNGIVAEIQVNTPKMIYAKERPEDAKRILGVEVWNAIRRETGMEGGLGHKYYEQWRVLDPTSKEAMEIARKSEEYYKHFR